MSNNNITFTLARQLHSTMNLSQVTEYNTKVLAHKRSPTVLMVYEDNQSYIIKTRYDMSTNTQTVSIDSHPDSRNLYINLYNRTRKGCCM